MGEIPRRAFVGCCAMGLCSTALLPVAEAAEQTPKATDAHCEWTQSQWDAARLRYAKFIEVMGREIDASTRKRLLRSLGRECALQYRAQTFEKYAGDIHGFLKFIQGPDGWVAEAEYNETAGVLRIVDKQKKCSCPLVQQGVTSGDHCECTLGWQTETYSRIFGRPVQAEVEESILRGGNRCVYRIKIA